MTFTFFFPRMVFSLSHSRLNTAHDPTIPTIIRELKQCIEKKDLDAGRHLHSSLKHDGNHNNIYVANTLISMYSKCGSIFESRRVFETMANRDAVSWNSLMLGYINNGNYTVVLDLFQCMDCPPNIVTFLVALKACGSLAASKKLEKKNCLMKAAYIHVQAKSHGFDHELPVANTLISVYCKCGSMVSAQNVFDQMVNHTVVSWNSLVLGYTENGMHLKALDLFFMIDCQPNHVTFLTGIRACVALASGVLDRTFCLEKGKVIHRLAKENRFDKFVVVANSLIDMYSRCGCMDEAEQTFRSITSHDTASWNALIHGFVFNEKFIQALEVFASMDSPPDSISYSTALKACSGLAVLDRNVCLKKGKEIHKKVLQHGFEHNIFVTNSLIFMYGQSRRIQNAWEVFISMSVVSDVVSWCSLMAGYMEIGEFVLALDIFFSMSCVPDSTAFVIALNACARIGALETGKKIHSGIYECGLEQVGMVATALVDFYGKCGDMLSAKAVFEKIKHHTVVSWTALIGGYSLHGDKSHMIDAVNTMVQSGLQMNNVTMLLVLSSVCSRTFSLEEARRHFELLSKFNIEPTMKHYTCMVDLLGSANRCEEALSLLSEMPFEPDVVSWMTLMDACKQCSNVDIGKIAFKTLISK